MKRDCGTVEGVCELSDGDLEGVSAGMEVVVPALVPMIGSLIFNLLFRWLGRK